MRPVDGQEIRVIYSCLDLRAEDSFQPRRGPRVGKARCALAQEGVCVHEED